MKRFEPVALLSLATLSALAGCSGGGGAPAPGEVKTGGNFEVLRTDPNSGGRIFLNDPIAIDLSNPIDLDSASLTTISFQALNQLNEPTSELVSGTFELSRAAGDTDVGRRLRFVPRFASNDDFTNGGLLPGRTYIVQLVDGQAHNGTVLRDRNGRGLDRGYSFSFSTIEGSQPAQLYRNPKPGGPTFVKVEVTTATSLDDVPLNLFGAPPVEVRLHFDQALNPASTNVPVNLDTNPLVRDINKRGRIYLEYHDPVLDPGFDEYTWIPADVELERNDLAGAVVALRPVGVLPNNATVRIIVENTLEDISGESNVGNLSYNRVFWEFKTTEAYPQQFNGIVEDFNDVAGIDLTAAFPESQAVTGLGFVKAGFSFEGSATTLEYEPTANEVVLNTDFTQVVPKAGLPFTVTGGIFNFRNVSIPQGVTVTGQGTKPMVWLCSGDFRVAGTLSVRGGNGARVDTLQSANFAKAGGVGSCGGGNGGDGTPSATTRDMTGATGNGPLQIPGKGGAGGKICCGIAGCYTGDGYDGSGGGSGGGGGTLATQGDPNWRGTPLGSGTGTSFQQLHGIGGAGCSGGSGTRTAVLAGGAAGPKVFVDAKLDNDFWGSAINIQTNTRITGELASPVGGGGGGGGGDTVPSNGGCTTPIPANDFSGGGGGAGGGVLIVKALGEIEITRSGKIIADGGHGGGGEQVGACGEAGGGGGGSGGMVVLMSAKRIILHGHGSPSANRWHYSQNDYSFSVSADGGVCTTGSFGSVVLADKYPIDGSTMMGGTTYDGEPLGGLGGMGIVQLMVPPGPTETPDGTNTLLDDNIQVLRATTTGSTVPITGLEKQKTLGWRGFPTATNQFVDDAGAPTGATYAPVQGTLAVKMDEGDIRPSPILMPVPFASKSRARSKWIDTGASQRRLLAAPDGEPRGVVGNEAGPIFSFAGLDNTNTLKGYLAFEPIGTAVRFKQPVVVDATSIVTASAEGSTYRFTVGGSPLGQADRFKQYEAELLNSAGSVVGSFRILSHTGNSLVVDAGTDVLPSSATKLQVRAKFFKVVTSGSEGLGPVYTPIGGQAIPNANLQIGFAFHKDPSQATGRFPTNNQQFVHDVDGLLQDPAFQAYVQANGMPRYVQWDVTFDLTYSINGSIPPSLNPNTPRPELHFLRLPFRF